jgi:hypothetical protein
VRVDLPRWRVAGYARVPVLIDLEVTAESKEEALAVARETLAVGADEVVQVQKVQKGMVTDWKPTAISVPARQLVNHHCQPLTAPKFTCLHCGSLFPWSLSVKMARKPKYCSATCRMYAWRLRKRAEKALEGEVGS